MPVTLTHKELKDKHRQLRDAWPNPVSLRVHRALSWLECAEKHRNGNDLDVAFVSYWIAFNAVYTGKKQVDERQPERSSIRGIFDTMADLDREERLFSKIWEQFSEPIRLILYNQYIFQPFWDNENSLPKGKDWESKLKQHRKNAYTALRNKNSAKVLTILFNQLYVLRNQLVHGCATWKSSKNRPQVKNGTQIMEHFVPIIIELLMDNPEVDWGDSPYGVVNQ